MNALEDIGFFCIDNVPAGLLPSITAFSKAGDNQLERVALSMDVRGCRSREQIERALDKLDEQGVDYKIPISGCPGRCADAPLQRDPPPPPHQHCRGHLHPGCLFEGAADLTAFAERADYTINTGLLSTTKNKERICDLFAKRRSKNAMRLTIMSLGSSLVFRRRQTLCWMCAACPTPSTCRGTQA